MAILDLAGANQSTVSFITNYGHRLYSDDFLHQLDQCFGQGDFYENQIQSSRHREEFLRTALDFPEEPSTARWCGTSWSIFLRPC